MQLSRRCRLRFVGALLPTALALAATILNLDAGDLIPGSSDVITETEALIEEQAAFVERPAGTITAAELGVDDLAFGSDPDNFNAGRANGVSDVEVLVSQQSRTRQTLRLFATLETTGGGGPGTIIPLPAPEVLLIGGLAGLSLVARRRARSVIRRRCP